MPQAIVFDFDNCIAFDPLTGEGSEEIKDRAWYDVFPEYDSAMLAGVLGDAQRAIAGGKGDRKDVACMVLDRFGFAGCISEEAIRRCDLFENVVQEGIKRIPIPLEVYGAMLRITQRIPSYLNTATPVEAMQKTLRALRLDLFKGVYGRPWTKTESLRLISAEEHAPFCEMVFVGDSKSDYDAAKQVGCWFIGVRTKRNPVWHKPQPFPVIGSVAELIGIA